ncbi:DUF4230 domain-containing protein [Pedobacter sp. HMF7647]|uniref:DUF4230 domain-containing protein n=2 Tax=Hufsiella arboris TaxID=2695275 RepID=A0A7K1YCU7_9SPHI|nr:DUF4230 domain-containing protein [Hufsiella arboris]
MRIRTTIILITTVVTVLFLVFVFFYFKSQLFSKKTELNEDVMVEKITSMGKLELVKYSMKDVLEKKEIRHILPDKRILFVAVGEVTGCIDLTKVSKSDISISDDSVTVHLPKPEICYAKIDHQKSKVYDISGDWFPGDTQGMMEDIYKVAEKRILQNAADMDILGKTKENAALIFRPLLENISGKKVGIVFK